MRPQAGTADSTVKMETGTTIDAFRSDAARDETNAPPLIDVLLVLVVILIVAAPMALQRLPLPGDPRKAGTARTLALSILCTGELSTASR